MMDEATEPEGILSPAFSFKTRPQLLSKLGATVWDLVVIGGGITGAAVARDAALRGLKVALLEAHDFASGTSSGSTKLIHGGLRYLEMFDFKLVFEAIREREKLRKLYAPFVEDIDFVFPTYRHRYPPRWKLNLGLTLYDSFSFFAKRHKNYSAKKTFEKFPWLSSEDLSGACVYADAFAEDYRLTIELIKSAHRNQAVCLSQMEVQQVQRQPHDGSFILQAADRWGSANVYPVRTRFVMNCTGPFSDAVRNLVNLPPALKLTQGVHFILPRKKLPIETAFVLSDEKLHRILFAIPWNSIVFLGTTDTSIRHPGDARALGSDLDYVLEIFRQYFKTPLHRSDIIQSWAAVRPLLKPAEAVTNSAISREHRIEEYPENFFHILGGKLTSHRLMAEDALAQMAKRTSLPPSKTSRIFLQDERVSVPTTDRLQRRWGRFAEDIKRIDRQRDLGERLVAGTENHRVSEVLYAIHHEMALSPLDYMRRRSSLYYELPSMGVAQALSQVFADEMIKDPSRQEQARKDFLDEVLKAFAWDQDGYKV